MLDASVYRVPIRAYCIDGCRPTHAVNSSNTAASACYMDERSELMSQLSNTCKSTHRRIEFIHVYHLLSPLNFEWRENLNIGLSIASTSFQIKMIGPTNTVAA